MLVNLVNDVLDMAQIKAGKFKLVSTTFNLKSLVTDVISLMRISADARHIPISSTVDPLLAETIKTDPNRIRQILINLVGNALKFTENGNIEIIA